MKKKHGAPNAFQRIWRRLGRIRAQLDRWPMLGTYSSLAVLITFIIYDVLSGNGFLDSLPLGPAKIGMLPISLVVAAIGFYVDVRRARRQGRRDTKFTEDADQAIALTREEEK